MGDIAMLGYARELGMEIAELPAPVTVVEDSRLRVARDLPNILRELWDIRQELKHFRKAQATLETVPATVLQAA